VSGASLGLRIELAHRQHGTAEVQAIDIEVPVTAIGFAVTGAAKPMVVTTRAAAARVFIIFDLLFWFRCLSVRPWTA